jgi:hypothetical protein
MSPTQMTPTIELGSSEESYSVNNYRQLRQSLARRIGAAAGGEDKQDEHSNGQIIFCRLAFRVLLCPTNVSCAAGDLQSQGLDRAAQRLHMQTIRDRTRLASYQTLSHVALYSCPRNLVAPMSLCLWGGAYRMTSYFL